jgi:hypothetical protein
MGWLFSSHWQDRKQLIAERTTNERNEKRSMTCLAHCLRGNVLWIVWEVELTEPEMTARQLQNEENRSKGRPERPFKEVSRYIGCDLLQNGGKEEGWGYKDMDESYQPFYYTCPIKYLDMVPDVTSQAWRDIVIERHRVKTMKLTPGTIVGLKNCELDAVKVISEKTCESRTGTRYSLKRRQLSGEVFDTWPVAS